MNHLIQFMTINGKIMPCNTLCLSPYDRGITLGHGLFETMRAHKGCLPLLAYHWQRLVNSAPLLDLKIPFTFSELQAMAEELLLKNNLTEQNVGMRLTITDGISERGIVRQDDSIPTFFMTCFPLPQKTTIALTATVVSARRNEQSLTSRVKSTSYLENVLAKKDAIARGFDEAFLLNTQSQLAEGSTTNVFVVYKQIIYTPPITDGALPGVIRHVLLNDLDLHPFTIEERSIDLPMLFAADAIFISNAIMGLQAIGKLDGVEFSGLFKVTSLINNLFEKQFYD